MPDQYDPGAVRRIESPVRHAAFGALDAILTPAATGEGPPGLSATGDPLFNRAWTLLQVPCIAMPFGRGETGLPLSVQLVARRHDDRRLLAVAAWAERHGVGLT